MLKRHGFFTRTKTAGQYGLLTLLLQRADVRNDGLDLSIGKLAFKGGHLATLAALYDRHQFSVRGLDNHGILEGRRLQRLSDRSVPEALRPVAGLTFRFKRICSGALCEA